MTTTPKTAAQIRTEMAAWVADKYHQAMANGATDEQAIAAVRSLFLEGMKGAAR